MSRFRSRADDAWPAMRAASVVPDSTLPLARRAALAAGMRLQFPFASRSILELAAARAAWSPPRGDSLRLLQTVVARRLPAWLMPASWSPQVPGWLRGALTTLVPSVLLAPRFDARGIVNRVALRSLWDQHCGGHHDHSLRLWALLMLELWFRHTVDEDASAEPEPLSVLRVA